MSIRNTLTVTPESMKYDVLFEGFSVSTWHTTKAMANLLNLLSWNFATCSILQ